MEEAIQRARDKDATLDTILAPCADIISQTTQQHDHDHDHEDGSYDTMGMNMGMGMGMGMGVGVGMSGVPPNLCRLYLCAVSTHADFILVSWNNGTLSTKQINDLMKAIRVAAAICATFNRSTLSSSGIIFALAKLAKGYKPTTFANASLLATTTTTTTNTNTNTNTNAITEESHKITLTPALVEFLQCCLLGSHYHFAKCFIENHPIYSLPTSSSSNNKSNNNKNNNNKSNNKNKNIGGGTNNTNNSTKKLITSETFLRYHYFVGLIHIGCGGDDGNADDDGADEYTSAISAFQTCLTIPSQIVSDISIAAWKKMVLCHCLSLYSVNEEEEEYHTKNSLFSQQQQQQRKNTDEKNNVNTSASNAAIAARNSLLVGKILELPNAVSTPIYKYFTSRSSFSNNNTNTNTHTHTNEPSSSSSSSTQSIRIYETLIQIFVSRNISSFISYMKQQEEEMVESGNLGLVKQMVSLIHYRNVRKIGSIYDALPLVKLADKLGLKDGYDLCGDMRMDHDGSNSSGNDHGNDHGVNAVESLLLQIAFRQMNSNASPSSSSKSHIDFSIDCESDSPIVYFYDDGFDSSSNGNGNGIGNGNGGEDVVNRKERERTQMELSKRIALAMDLAERVTKMDIALTTSSKYQSTIGRENPEEGAGGGDTKKGRSVIAEI